MPAAAAALRAGSERVNPSRPVSAAAIASAIADADDEDDLNT